MDKEAKVKESGQKFLQLISDHVESKGQLIQDFIDQNPKMEFNCSDGLRCITGDYAEEYVTNQLNLTQLPNNIKGFSYDVFTAMFFDFLLYWMAGSRRYYLVDKSLQHIFLTLARCGIPLLSATMLTDANEETEVYFHRDKLSDSLLFTGRHSERNILLIPAGFDAPSFKPYINDLRNGKRYVAKT